MRASGHTLADRREYFFDMVAQLAIMGRQCGEGLAAHILEAIVLAGAAQTKADLRYDPSGKSMNQPEADL